ncbi:hypothetical protein AYK24_05390 [Thermoplasmatales archaeon SG8-52-4]|nr:MAG: hypothetical protein AYK24_05390 [Thermoplasmatales archaeon SG8-52-4]
MKIDIRKKHLFKNLLIKQILSSYIVTFLIIASFSLIVLGVYGNVVDAKKLFTTTDSSDDSTETASVSPAASKANENSVISTDTTNPAEEKTEPADPTTIANENSVIAIDSKNPATEKSVTTNVNIVSDENLIESNNNESDFWIWLSNYDDEEDDDVKNYNSEYSYNQTIKLKELGIISKLKNKLFNNNYYFTASFLLNKFEKYFK